MSKIGQVGKRKDKGLKLIRESVLDMFEQLIVMFNLSKELLKTDSKEIAFQIIDADNDLDDMMSDLIIEISNFITREQPFAQDLRITIGNLSIISDLERMGDHLKGFAKVTLKVEVNSKTQNEILNQLIDDIYIRVLKLKDIYIALDHKGAKKLAKQDTDIDGLVKKLLKNVNYKLSLENDLKEIDSLTRIQSLARLFERSGDHIINICEQISYINKGQIYHYM